MKHKKIIIISIAVIVILILTFIFYKIIKKLDVDTVLFPNYEHYTLDPNEGVTYSYLDNYDLITYKVIQLDFNESGEVDGLFYKINNKDNKDNEYILLEKLPEDKSEKILEKWATQFIDNKLYIIRGWGNICEYTLNKENIIKKEIKLDTEKVSNDIIIVNSFIKIDEEYLYLKATNYTTGERITMKCDKDNLICDINDYITNN